MEWRQIRKKSIVNGNNTSSGYKKVPVDHRNDIIKDSKQLIRKANKVTKVTSN